MTEREIQGHIEVLTAAVACIAVENLMTGKIRDALNALAKSKPELLAATSSFLQATQRAEQARQDAATARMRDRQP